VTASLIASALLTSAALIASALLAASEIAAVLLTAALPAALARVGLLGAAALGNEFLRLNRALAPLGGLAGLSILLAGERPLLGLFSGLFHGPAFRQRHFTFALDVAAGDIGSDDGRCPAPARLPATASARAACAASLAAHLFLERGALVGDVGRLKLDLFFVIIRRCGLNGLLGERPVHAVIIAFFMVLIVRIFCWGHGGGGRRGDFFHWRVYFIAASTTTAAAPTTSAFALGLAFFIDGRFFNHRSDGSDRRSCLGGSATTPSTTTGRGRRFDFGLDLGDRLFLNGLFISRFFDD